MESVTTCRFCGRNILAVTTNLDHRLYVDFGSIEGITKDKENKEVFIRLKHRNTCPQKAIYQEKVPYGKEF